VKLAKKTALFLIFLSLIWLLLSITQHDSFSFLIDFDTGCPHDTGTNLFTGEKYGWPFYFIYVGYIERCVTAKPMIPDVRFILPAMDVNLPLYATIFFVIMFIIGFYRWGPPFIEGFFIWLIMHMPGWNKYTCKVRLIPPVGPYEPCGRLCKDHEWCWEISSHG